MAEHVRRSRLAGGQSNVRANASYLLFREHADAPLRRWMGSSGAAFVIAVLAFGLGSLVSIAGPEIRAASRALLFGPRSYGPHWLTIGFWVGSLVWSRLLYLKLVVDQRGQERRDQMLEEAMFRAPNPQLFREYRAFHDKAEDLLRAALTQRPLMRADLVLAIQPVLNIISTMASQFANADEDVNYGANIMLVASPSSVQGQPLFAEELLASLRFFDRDREQLSWLSALLYLPSELASTANVEHPTRRFTLITLPVPRQVANPRTKKRWALPGAPSALLEGRPSLHEDTYELDLSGYDLHDDVKSQIREYFGPEGHGSAVRSFVSLRIGRERENPIGILNIDSDHPNVLGDDRYHNTFYALVTPFLSMLAAPVAEYAHLLTEEKARNVAQPISASESHVTPRASA